MKKNGISREKVVAGASLFAAMAHPMRAAIFDLLTANERLSVTEIYERLDIQQAAASCHLNILKNKGILESEREGKKIFYSLKRDKLEAIVQTVDRWLEL